MDTPLVVEVQSLTPWSETQPPPPSSEPTPPPSISNPPIRFPFNALLNTKIRLWQGEVWRLKADAIVNSTNESITETQGLCGIINERAGPDLQAEIDKLDGCRTGEAKIIPGLLLPSRYLIFTVGPRYNPKYHTAAENALHTSYRSCLQIAKEHSLSSIAFCTIHSEARGYPPENGAHVAIRTIRRFLEKYGETIHDVVLCLDRLSDYDLYQRVLPLYFPRDKDEETRSTLLLPEDTGDENGETVIEERKIRILTFPGTEDGNEDEDYDSDHDLSGLQGVDDPPASILAEMQGDPDEEKRRAFANKSDEELERERTELLYNRYMRRARDEDLSDVAQRGVFYRSGVDQMGRPLFVLVGLHLPKAEEELDKVLAYIIRILNPIINKDFVVVYFHTNMAQESLPDLAWLRKLHDIFNYKYAKTMRALYVVHHTFWLKVMAMVLSPFMNAQITDKLRYFSGLGDLLGVLDLQQLNIPDEVFQYDTRANGSNWHKSTTQKSEDEEL